MDTTFGKDSSCALENGLFLWLTMRYREVQPRPPLNRFIECFWTLESDVNSGLTKPESILPDGCVELILNFGAPFSELIDNGLRRRQPAHFLVGQMTQPVSIAPTGPVQVLGVRFHPAGTSQFLHLPMHEMTNQIVELEAIDPALARDLIAVACSVTSLQQKVAAIETCLAARVREISGDFRFIELAASAVRRGGKITVDRLSADAGISGRQLERRFLRDVGIGPKMFCRILRFQQVFQAVEQQDAGWAAVAADCGYYDQAHLIRDFQEFARQTPAVQMAQSGPLTEAFTRKNRAT